MAKSRFLTLAALAALVVSACGGSAAPSATIAPTPSAATETATTAPEPSGEVEFWAWSTNVEEMVALFEQENPGIKVKLVNNGSGATQYEKLQVAFAAGSGAPDVAMVEFPYITQYALEGNIVPLDNLGGAGVVDDFADSVRAQATVNGKLYGVPLDSAPMAYGYREDLLVAAGITTLPSTWQEFADAAAKYHSTDTKAWIANSPISDGTFIQMMWAAGLSPVKVDGTTITLDFTSADTEQLLSFWVDLAKKGDVGTIPAWTPEWNQGFASGALSGWLMPGWGPVILKSAAPDTSGKWRVSRLPSADGTRSSSEWGGSAYTVTAQSKNPAAAARLAIWLNHEPMAYEKLFELTGSFPVLKAFASDPKIIDAAFEYFGGQPVNSVFAEEQAAVNRSWQWSPFQTTVASVVAEQTLAAQNGKVTPAEALAKIQGELVDYAKGQGFDVREGS